VRIHFIFATSNFDGRLHRIKVFVCIGRKSSCYSRKPKFHVKLQTKDKKFVSRGGDFVLTLFKLKNIMVAIAIAIKHVRHFAMRNRNFYLVLRNIILRPFCN
jgi:hypothetical protein